MKEKFGTNKGITLIALIITIIVLLILAMVSIKLVWDGGIITHAQNAVNAYNEAQTNELAQLKKLEEEMLSLGGGNSGDNNDPEENWWEFRGDEETQLANHIQSEVQYVIATNNQQSVLRTKGIYENYAYDYIMITGETAMYIILFNDSTVEMYNRSNE